MAFVSLILTCKAARFVYDRKTKGPQKARASKKQQDSDTDHWEGGKTYMSDTEDDNNDEEMASMLDRNTSFLINMSKTGGFSVPHTY